VRFKAQFLQPTTTMESPTPDAKPTPTLMHIPDSYRTPDGQAEGQDPDIAMATQHADELTGKAEPKLGVSM
jgi:hypothetical protein